MVPHDGQVQVLQGIAPSAPRHVLIQLDLLSTISSDTSESAAMHPAVQPLLSEFSDLFQEPTELPPSRACDHEIPLVLEAQPVFIRPYRYPPKLKNEIERQVHEMLQQGLIRPNTSSFSSLVLLVKKDSSYCFCMDFRHLNALTQKSKFPVPVFDQLMDELHGASWFSTLDLRVGFHQILLRSGEEFKTAFQMHFGQYEFNVMAFIGLTGAPGTFQGAMNATLSPGLWKFIVVFFDDILVYNSSLEEHISHLRQVFQWLRANSWKLKLSKCKFACESISYLGHVISATGLSTDPSKVQAVMEWPLPLTVKDLHGFLGLAGYYRKFVKNFGIMAKPFTDLLRKDQLFVWTENHTVAFQLLKEALWSAPILALPKFSQPFHIDTDASGSGIGIVLHQGGHPLAFISKPLSSGN